MPSTLCARVAVTPPLEDPKATDGRHGSGERHGMLEDPVPHATPSPPTAVATNAIHKLDSPDHARRRKGLGIESERSAPGEVDVLRNLNRELSAELSSAASVLHILPEVENCVGPRLPDAECSHALPLAKTAAQPRSWLPMQTGLLF